MKIKKTTCWYDKNICKEMLKGARGQSFPILEKSEHFFVLKQLMGEVKKTNCRLLLDIGCGAAEISRCFPEFRYAGADLENIIENVAKVMHPKNTYISFDVYEDSLEFIKDYDIVVCNSFFDVLLNPLECLEKVLTNVKKYIIIHRQVIIDGETNIEKYDNEYYGGKSYKTYINKHDFKEMIEKCGFEKLEDIQSVKKENALSINRSYLLRKI